MLNCNLKQFEQDSQFLSYPMITCSAAAKYTTKHPKTFVDMTPTPAYSNVTRPNHLPAVGPGSVIIIDYGRTFS